MARVINGYSLPQLLTLFCIIITFGSAQDNKSLVSADARPAPSSTINYPLGPGDQITIWALGVEEMSDKPMRIDASGNLNLPIVGSIHAAGLTTDQLKKKLEEVLLRDVKHPEVTVNITELHSQPVSVLGAVTKPGIYQLQGRKTLSEVLSLAEGPKTEAGNEIKIKRRKEYGAIPLPNAHFDQTGNYSIATVSLTSVMKGTASSVYLAPDDEITVPASPLVYVIGEVKKPGGFVMGTRENVSVLQALSMAEGLDKYAKSNQCRLLRSNGTPTRTDIPVDLRGMMEGKRPDITMLADDILVVPTSRAKSGMAKVGEVAVSAITGVAIYRVGLGF